MPDSPLAAIPSAVFSFFGFLALAAWLIFGVPYADLVAFLLLGAVGCGTAIAFFMEVRRKRAPWTWKGIAFALSRPSHGFWLAFLSHAPQLVIAVIIALYWRSRQ